MRRRWWTTTIAAGLLVGCAGQPVHIDAPVLPVPLVEPLPLRVGLILPPGLRTKVFRDPMMGNTDIEVGEASAAALRAAAQAGFEAVVELDALPTTAPVDAVLELVANEWSSRQAADGQTTTAQFDLRLSEPAGVTIGQWSTRQQVELGEYSHEPGEKFSLRFRDISAVPPTILLEKVEAALLRDFRDEPAIRRWLEARSAYRPALPPVVEAGDLPAATPLPGIVVASDVASSDVRRCVARGLRDHLPERPLLGSNAVRRALFPWFSDRPAAAVAAERVLALAHYPPAVVRFAELGLGTVILVGGGTRQEWHGGGFCGAGYGGGGCLGLEWGKRDSVIVARIMDLSRPHDVHGAESHKSGTAVLPMFGLPLPFIPATQSAACEEMSKALVRELTRPSPPGN